MFEKDDDNVNRIFRSLEDKVKNLIMKKKINGFILIWIWTP